MLKCFSILKIKLVMQVFYFYKKHSSIDTDKQWNEKFEVKPIHAVFSLHFTVNLIPVEGF